MDSLQARVFALALPAIGLLVSGSAVDATATETNQTVAVAPDGFTAIGTGLSIRSGSGVASTPTSLNFVQRMPAPDVDDSTKSEPLESTSPAKVIKRDAANTITKLPPVEVETPVGDELPPMEATTALDSAPVAPEPKAIGETNAPRRLPSITNEVPSDRDSQKWVIDSTPPSVSHTTVSGALVSYDEPVIHIVRRESPPSMKREFYNDQFAAPYGKSTAEQSGSSTSSDANYGTRRGCSSNRPASSSARIRLVELPCHEHENWLSIAKRREQVGRSAARCKTTASCGSASQARDQTCNRNCSEIANCESTAESVGIERSTNKTGRDCSCCESQGGRSYSNAFKRLVAR